MRVSPTHNVFWYLWYVCACTCVCVHLLRRHALVFMLRVSIRYTRSVYYVCASVAYRLYATCIGMYINVSYVCVSITYDLYVMCVHKLHPICIGMYINVSYVCVSNTYDLYVMCVFISYIQSVLVCISM